MPLAVCRSEPAWRRYRRWLEGVVSQAGFNRLELIEQPWAAAWGAGMKVKPEDIYIVVNMDAAYLEAAVVQAINQTGNGGNSRHIRVLSYGAGWLTDKEDDEPSRSSAAIVHQVLREAELRGYTLADLAGAIVTGSAVQCNIIAALRKCFAGVTIYDREPLATVACGAAVLSAGIDGCGYLRYGYTVRCLGEAGYHYREVVPRGTFYPNEGQIAELIIKASYDGQKEFAVLLYRGEDQCINEENPLLFTLEKSADKGQPVIRIRARLDGAGQLLVTADDLINDTIIMDNKPAVKLV
jgi:molecular chaperone DnaK (HSP70)